MKKGGEPRVRTISRLEGESGRLKSAGGRALNVGGKGDRATRMLGLGSGTSGVALARTFGGLVIGVGVLMLALEVRLS